MPGWEIEISMVTVTMGITSSVVNAYTEWDPLEEVIVGRLEGAHFPSWNVINDHTVPSGEWTKIAAKIGGAGAIYPQSMMAAAQQELDGLIEILRTEGVTVRRPDQVSYSKPYATPDWRVEHGFCAANPRDPFLVIGNEIIEAPMADRGRYFEAWAYRSLFKEYLQAGARWTAAPKPRLDGALYKSDHRFPVEGEPMSYILTEFEPVFDAADFVRCGRDLFVQRSHVTNDLGILWLQNHLTDKHRIHVLETRNPEAIHIDTTFMPLAPGKVLVSPEYIDVDGLPAILKNWEILIAPEPLPNNDPLKAVSKWISINVLMLDEERVIVEKHQIPMIKALKEWGFKPIPCAFENYYPFLGGFHCATLDIRRRGDLQSYF
uniref:Glycine amidinotransferase n=1 Tax=Candidatus Kentrum sp. FW TaxID=2126338 RepID=A0A450TH65_9GAMM|nr:MAG: glycine amidinotransferase [Candidatus Kentron sp. FW]